MLLVYNLDNKVFICLDHIVSMAMVEVMDEKNKIIQTHKFWNSNFEKVDLKERKGDFTIRINCESETIIRHIQL